MQPSTSANMDEMAREVPAYAELSRDMAELRSGRAGGQRLFTAAGVAVYETNMKIFAKQVGRLMAPVLEVFSRPWTLIESAGQREAVVSLIETAQKNLVAYVAGRGRTKRPQEMIDEAVSDSSCKGQSSVGVTGASRLICCSPTQKGCVDSLRDSLLQHCGLIWNHNDGRWKPVSVPARSIGRWFPVARAGPSTARVLRSQW